MYRSLAYIWASSLVAAGQLAGETSKFHSGTGVRESCVTAVCETELRGNTQLLGGLHGRWKPVAWPGNMPLLSYKVVHFHIHIMFKRKKKITLSKQ